jgi:hypothetical protein
MKLRRIQLHFTNILAQNMVFVRNTNIFQRVDLRVHYLFRIMLQIGILEMQRLRLT